MKFHHLLIEGIAAIPRFSMNKRYYPARELAKLDGKTVPILWMHEGTPENVGDKIPEDKIIGEATVYWREDLQQLWYQGKVEEEYSWTVQLAKGVSMGAHYTRDLLFSTNLILEEISLVIDAGIPETTVKVVEEYSYSLYPQLDLTSKIKLEYHMKARATSA